MKARVKATGEIVYVEEMKHLAFLAQPYFFEIAGFPRRTYYKNELELIKDDKERTA